MSRMQSHLSTLLINVLHTKQLPILFTEADRREDIYSNDHTQPLYFDPRLRCGRLLRYKTILCIRQRKQFTVSLAVTYRDPK